MGGDTCQGLQNGSVNHSDVWFGDGGTDKQTGGELEVAKVKTIRGTAHCYG